MRVIANTSGSWDHTMQFLAKASDGADVRSVLESAGSIGVAALASATPVESGTTASSWSYEVVHSGGAWSLNFLNNNINKGVNIAIILQYGHGTGTGGYVSGRDYINPAIQPIFDKIAEDVWKAVNS